MNKSTLSALFHIFPFLILFLCHQSPLKAQGFEKEGERFSAYEFSRKMGRGANFMAAKIEGRFHSNHDFKLLAENHFTHCRIGGKFNLHMGSAPDYIVDADRIADMQEAADFCLDNGLIAVIDPLHLYNEYYSDDQLPVLKKIWEQVATAFADYPVDHLAFEIMNEPHNGYDMKGIVHESLAAIRKVAGNEERIVIVSGQGFTTRMALVKAFQNDIFPADDKYIIGTFHYYDPKSFTKQGTFGVTTQWGESGANDPAWTVVEEAFDEVVEANQEWGDRNSTVPLPVYLGEYGVDNQAPAADRKRWLCWIRMQAEKRDFSTALWNMYSLTSKGIGPWTSEQKKDPTTRYLQEDMVEVLMTRYEMEAGEVSGGIQENQSFHKFSGEGYVDFSNALQGDKLLLNSIYIPKTDTYQITFRYRNSSQNEAFVDLTVYDSKMNKISELKQLAFYPSKDANAWSKIVVDMEFGADSEAIIQISNKTRNNALLIDYLSVSMGEYHDYLYPAVKEVTDITTGIGEVIDVLDGQIEVYPTAFTNYTTIYQELNNKEKVIFYVNDIMGRPVQKGVLHAYSGNVRLGHEYNDGYYFLNFIGGDWRKCIKLIKISGV